MQALRELGIAVGEMTWPRLLERQARRNGDKTYVIFEGTRYTYEQVERLTRRLAAGLLESGIGPGTHVALLLANCPENLFLNMALGRVGAVACPVNTAARGDLLSYFLTISKARAVILGSSCVERFAEVAGRLDSIERVLFVHDTEEQAAGETALGLPIVRYGELEQSDEDRPLPLVRPEDPHAIMFTSGTTGPSKGIVVSNAQSFGFSIGRVEYLGLKESDVVFTCLPLFHGNALNAAAVPAFVADATLVLARRFSARAFWGQVRENRVTQFNLLSSMTNILWGQPPSAQDRDHRVRQCTMVPVPTFAHEFAQRFGVEIVSSYSLTDFGQGTFLQPGAPVGKFRSAGQPRPGVELRIVDDDDRPAPVGEAGEICLRSSDPSLSGRHYFEMPRENERAWRGGWFHTGDRGYLDADGYLFFVDRKKDAIRRRGENISSWEVEQVIARHPSVAEVAVYPVTSELSEDEVMASIVPHAGQEVDPVELIRFCERNMAYFMVPRFLEFVSDLPRTLTEKVQKQELRKRAEADLSRLWDRERLGITLSR
jgi:crotonobetaine/carnitine-CoA ligase